MSSDDLTSAVVHRHLHDPGCECLLIHAAEGTTVSEALSGITRQHSASSAPVLVVLEKTSGAADRTLLLRSGADCVLDSGGDTEELMAWLEMLTARKLRVDQLLQQNRFMTDVAEHTHAHLQVSERRLENLFRFMAEGFCLLRVICDENARMLDFEFVMANDVFYQLTGAADGALTGMHVSDWSSRTPHTPPWRPHLHQLAESGGSTDFSCHFPRQDRWFDVHAYAAGALEIGVLIIDATARKSAEDALVTLNRTLEQQVAARTFQLQALIDLDRELGAATSLLDMSAAILHHTRSVVPCEVVAIFSTRCDYPLLHVRTIGAADPRFREQLKSELLPELAWTESCRENWEVLEEAPTSPTVNHWLRIPLRTDSVSAQDCILLGLEGASPSAQQTNALRALTAHASFYLERRHRTVQAEQRRLESIMSNLPLGLLVLDDQYRLLMSNPAATAILRPPEGSPMTEYFETRTGLSLKDVLRAAPDEAVRRDIRVDDGQELMLLATHGEIALGTNGWIVILEDVTRERKVQRHVGQQERLAAVGELAAGIAHDFNNSLTAIIGISDLLLMRGNLNEYTSSRLKMVGDQGRKAAQLVQQILDFGRKSVSEMTPVEMTGYLKQTVRLLRRTIPETISIQYVAKVDACWIHGDANQIEHALMNLSVNAAHAMPNGGTLQLTADCLNLEPGQPAPYPDLAPGGWFVLDVSDTGTGISAEVLPHIFEPFYTTKERHAGTGLGLAQVYGLIRKHNGYVDVKSNPGEGTTFTLYLPVLAGGPDAVETTEDFRERTFSNERLTVLLVEDEEPVRQVLESMLEEAGLQVLSASNGREGLAVFERLRKEIDLIITDLTMPIMGGEEFYQAVRQRDPRVAFVFMTGYALHQEQQSLLNRHDVRCLQKPIKFNDLVQLITHFLDNAGEGPSKGSD